VLISEYFQKIESQIADCIYIIETSLVKDKRSLHIHSNNVIEASIPAFAQVLNEISDLIGQST